MPACTNCCIGCDIASDTFGTDLSAWTQVVGVWSVSGGQLVAPATGIIVHNTAPLTEFDGVRVVFTPITASTTATVRLICAYTDTSNYLFGQFSIAGTVGTIRLGMVEGGTTTFLTSEVTVNDNTAGTLDDAHTMRLCWQPGTTQDAHSSFTLMTCASVSNDSGSAPEAVDCDSITADLGISNATTPRTYTATFAGGIPPGSTVDGVEFSVRCSATQTTTITVTVGVALGTATASAGTFTTTDSLATYGTAGTSIPISATWQDANGLTGTRNVSATFARSVAPAGDIISVDCFELTIHYTTPANTPGTLRMQYVNTIDATTDCTGTIQTYPPSTGLKTGLQVTAGTWFANDFDLDYLFSDSLHRTCTTCVCAGICFNCCDNDSPPAQSYSLDFGAGGWTRDRSCLDPEYCDDIAGVIIVEQALECYWTYSAQAIPCSNTVHDSFKLVQLFLISDGTNCYWEAWVTVLVQTNGGPVPDNVCADLVKYRSGNLASTADCQTVPVTLTMFDSQTGTGGACCNGSLPTTIELDIP